MFHQGYNGSIELGIDTATQQFWVPLVTESSGKEGGYSTGWYDENR